MSSNSISRRSLRWLGFGSSTYYVYACIAESFAALISSLNCNRHIKSSAITLLLLLLLVVQASAETVSGMVKAVFDGDTVLLVANGGRMKVRLYGIDAPETAKKGRSGQPFAAQSKRVLMYKTMGRVVTADIQEKDQYNRAVAVIRLAGRDINAEMVAEGMAWAYRRYLTGPYASEYIGLEARARKQRRGLWRDGNPQPPWEFRGGRQ